jgi:hypothetical protein
MIIMPSKMQITIASKVTRLRVNIESFDLKIGFSLIAIMLFFKKIKNKEK